MKIKRIEHIAIAIKDMQAMSAVLQDKFGLTLEYAEELGQHQTKLAMFPVGETYVELLQGTSAAAKTSEFIKERGEGLYHICFEVEDIDEALAELKAKGTRLLNEVPMIGHGNSRIAFIDPASTGGILFELAEMPKSGH
ncbi:MAG: methylmalonyl-CoA epimerase [Alphaproteobacteria bacterium]|nr:methylmalonyl-CoA epimerase [Alphaproteobacteria bacterium]